MLGFTVVGFYGYWVMRLLGFAVVGFCGCWGLRLLGFAVVRFCGCKVLRLLVFAVVGLYGYKCCIVSVNFFHVLKKLMMRKCSNNRYILMVIN